MAAPNSGNFGDQQQYDGIHEMHPVPQYAHGHGVRASETQTPLIATTGYDKVDLMPQEKTRYLAGPDVSSGELRRSQQSYIASNVYHDPDMPPTSAQKRWQLIAWGMRYALIVITVGVALAIPMIITSRDRFIELEASDAEVHARQYANLVFYIFAWLEITWLSGCATDMFIMAMPYLFRFVAR